VRFEWRAHERAELQELAAMWAGATEADFQEFKREFDALCAQNAESTFRNFPRRERQAARYGDQ
jgi:hypothetical protein